MWINSIYFYKCLIKMIAWKIIYSLRKCYSVICLRFIQAKRQNLSILWNRWMSFIGHGKYFGRCKKKNNKSCITSLYNCPTFINYLTIWLLPFRIRLHNKLMEFFLRVAYTYLCMFHTFIYHTSQFNARVKIEWRKNVHSCSIISVYISIVPYTLFSSLRLFFLFFIFFFFVLFRFH